jgi:AraC-like DNA-binding protein/uncharacterized cupin superfamily protein
VSQSTSNATDATRRQGNRRVAAKSQAGHPILPLPRTPIAGRALEILGDANPIAVEVAEPLFRAGIVQAGIYENSGHPTPHLWSAPHHQFVLLLQGSMSVETNGRRSRLNVGDLAFFPAEAQSMLTGKKKGSFRYLYFKIRPGAKWKALTERAGWVRQYESADYMFLLLRRILNAYRTQDVVSVERARSDCYALLDLLTRELSETGEADDDLSIRLRDLVEDIRQNPGADWNNGKMATGLHLSVRTFHRVFLKEYGVPPRTMVIKQRLVQATHKLAFSRDKLSKIARDVGYSCTHTFSNLFLKHVGLRPGEFRRTHST